MTNLLLHYGADPNISPNQYILAPILFPILAGMIRTYKSKIKFPEKVLEACVLTLLKSGANVHCKSNIKGAEQFNHLQPIHYAAVFGNTGVLKTLLDYGADVYAPGLFNRTLLKCAEMYGHTETANVIRKWISQEEIIKKL
ncbi:Similar to Tankyrase-1; acc. no. O95271 [Pyronema omphalodes CBS 100304]|uniref:Similar to Tankyrase-1 acc. no. O95271 n=1 Tax=Pyronema omphalodes (strain CBS 100304) TaxID=1076935 RepID=U4L656_PYROM|nr:Similar to Tankyrase-1; acc. no. O95271 [Pyronema omphalodes CBS 100304]